MTGQDLHGAQVASRLVDDRCFGAPKRVRSVLLGLKADARNPLPNKPTILPRAHVVHVVIAARENKVVQRAAASLKPGEQGLPSWFNDFELYRALALLLHDNGPVANATTGHYISDPDFDDVAAAQFAVDCEVEEGSIP
ncbi:hypothetical protein NOVOSPHI9U_30057 [Novosphingobium sp. 9U]|nr:hypothetical protein NOVOSPHI9U_30057 [Novosphingobium sp. 9U]